MGWVGFEAELGVLIVVIGCLVGGFRLVIVRWLGLFVGLFVGLFFILWVVWGGWNWLFWVV